MRAALLTDTVEPGDERRLVPKGTARQALRKATRPEHERVDSLPLMRRLLHARVTTGDYGTALERLMLLHAALSGQLSDSLADCAHPRLRPSDLEGALLADLAALGWRITREPEPAPGFATGAEALGAWYVLEGAALGGAVIARHLREQLGPDLPLRHFGRDGERRWPEFLRHLEERLDSAADVEAAVRGARSAYRFTARTLAV